MGFYDREYYRQEAPSGISLGLPGSIVVRLIVVNAVLWLVDGLFFADDHLITRTLALESSSALQPWMWWQFVSYGFVHSVGPEHLLFNMFALWMFGTDVEGVLGRRQFLGVYLLLIVAGGIGWLIVDRLFSPAIGPGGVLLGASAAVTGVVLLYVFHFPRRTILLFFVLPIPAWLLGVLLVGGDVLGAVGRGGSQVAYSAHLTGAAVAAAYHLLGLNIARLLPGGGWPLAGRRGLRIHRPDDAPPPPAVDAEQARLDEEVDRLLEKIHQHGEASLSREERQLLESASRAYQKRRRET